MKQISELEQKIRSKVNSCHLYDRRFSNYLDEWNALCVAMDTLGDSSSALQDSEASGFGQQLGERYLRMYGFFQAIFLQQDSIRQLYRIFVGVELRCQQASAWQRLRELRNLTVGHPLEKNDKTVIRRCFISQPTINARSFTLLIWNKAKGEESLQDVDLGLVYEGYKSEAIGWLNLVEASMEC